MFHRPKSDEEKPRRQLKITALNEPSGSQKEPSDRAPARRADHDRGDISDADIGKKLKAARRSAEGKPPARGKTARDSAAAKRAKNERPMTEARIRNISEFQLSQRDYTTGTMRDMLHRRAFAWLRTLEGAERAEQEAEFRENVEKRINELVEAGLIDDARYARLKARSMRLSGKGARRIQMDLAKKGVEQSLIEDAIAEVDAETVDVDDADVSAEESERAAAETLARKKKIGPYRRSPAPENHAEKTKIWRREAGVLARAGYGLDIIREILDREPEEDEW